MINSTTPRAPILGVRKSSSILELWKELGGLDLSAASTMQWKTDQMMSIAALSQWLASRAEFQIKKRLLIHLPIRFCLDELFNSAALNEALVASSMVGPMIGKRSSDVRIAPVEVDLDDARSDDGNGFAWMKNVAEEDMSADAVWLGYLSMSDLQNCAASQDLEATAKLGLKVGFAAKDAVSALKMRSRLVSSGYSVSGVFFENSFSSGVDAHSEERRGVTGTILGRAHTLAEA